MKEHYYNNLELFEIARQCKSQEELYKCAKALRFLWNMGYWINLELFRRLAHIRAKDFVINN